MSTDDETRKKLVANEQAKLSATYLNGIAIAVVAVGGIAPLFASRPAAAATQGAAILAAVLTIVCFIVSAGLHFLARGLLKELR